MSIASADRVPYCALCGDRVSERLYSARDLTYDIDVDASLWRCPSCGLIFLWPVPDDLERYYPETYGPHEPKIKDALSYGWVSHFGLRHRARLVQKIAGASEPVLDLGCAAGQFLAASVAIDDRAHIGMDVNLGALTQARHQLDLDVCLGDAMRLPLPAHSVGVVTMWHVFEHLPDPKRMLMEIARVLRPDGVLVLACPMADSLEAQMFGRYWAGYDLPRHLFAYTRATLHRMMTTAGFGVCEKKGVVFGYSSARISSALCLKHRSPLRNRPALIRPLSALLGLGFSAAFALLDGIFHTRSAVGVFVARPASRRGLGM